MGTNDRVLIYCTCHFQAGSLCFSFFCLLVSSVSDFRPDTRRVVVDTFLGSLVQSHCGEGGMLQTNNTGVCAQCLSHTGPAPAHGACALPAHTAQAVGCSARNRLGQALGFVHLPGLSHSGSGTQVVLRCADLAGPAFCAFPRSKCCRCDLSPPPTLPLGFLGVQPEHIFRRMLTVQNPKKS